MAESVSSVERVDTWPETAPTHLKVYITQWVREYKQGWMDSSTWKNSVVFNFQSIYLFKFEGDRLQQIGKKLIYLTAFFVYLLSRKSIVVRVCVDTALLWFLRKRNSLTYWS